MAFLGRGIPSIVQTAKTGQSLPSIRIGFTPDIVERFSTSAHREEEASATLRSSASVDLVMQEQASCSSSSIPSTETFGRQPDQSPKAKSLDQNPALAQSSVPFSARQFWTSTFRQAANQAQPLGNGRRAYLVDTLALVRRLESEGLTAKQAEAITHVITEVLSDSLENVAQNFTSKVEMQKHDLAQDAAIQRFKSEVQSAQEHHIASLQRETERLRTDIEKMRSELRYEIDKVTAGQRLDLNLERGRIREELSNQSQETGNIATRLDRELHVLKTQLEAAKYDVIKYCLGAIVSVTAVGLGVLRLVL
ncbi:hypothetical protein KFL_001830020 [Klebsormidium nitens]|uniref:Protein FMP32, mitochondrial n=1 Tax=Klebsormidium nitens TaxID=105231 RepID=A0A1Y1I035_KLENI|nr:hypothetical protein KFL_001830020 [Klebsormidium nitens]|eukprot:GAQ84274.1 hypothetical protein KFL_001830020 [Klebsormidium nitens]